MYNFNTENSESLTLSETALNHILSGDLVDRLITDANGKRTGEKETILKGGMHTVEGFKAFRTLHSDMEHLMFFESDKHKYWYYARELQNLVVNLRLPRELYQTRAAKLTNFPDENYKSGYLWKTLFPESWSKDDIVNAIDLALQNLDLEACSEGEFIGYAHKEQPLKTMRISVLHRDGEIKSAFPTWTQPCTGNNGKPYSHFDSIGHVMAESTLYFDSEPKLYELPDTKLLGHDKNMSELPHFTPRFILNRELVGESEIDAWSVRKNYKLMELAGSADEVLVNKVKEYLRDPLIIKGSYLTPNDLYHHNFFNLAFSKQVFNAFHIHQNIIDCILFIGFYDNFKTTNHSKEVIGYLLSNMVTITGCLDGWNKKRIFNNIIEVILSHHERTLVADFLRWVSQSPSKRELFIDINCATFDKLDLTPENVIVDDEFAYPLYMIHITEQPIKCKLNHFSYFYKLNLGESYLSNFDDERLDEFFEEHNSFSLKMFIRDSIKFTRSKDLMLFSEQIKRMIFHIIDNNVIGVEDSTYLAIFKDYYRIQSAQRLRINLYFKDVAGNDLDYSEPRNIEFIRGTCLKHERICNSQSINQFFDSYEKLSEYLSSHNISKVVREQRELYSREVPPLPDMTLLSSVERKE